ncbi:MAG TPA: site-specific integrase, partial [Spirochaetales bacterium]|nr:site-specific integrase [Spirochaetales bacterium]
MEKPKAPYSLHKRPTKNKNRYIYYVQFRDQDGNYTSALSTGQTSKSSALIWTTEYLKKGYIPTKRGFTFEKFSKDWWMWDKCNYIKGKLARGMTISRRYAEESRRNLEKHLIPYFGEWKITDMKPSDIETWLMGLYEKSNLAPATINRILATLKVMLKEAERLGYIAKDPSKNTGILKEKPKEKTTLTLIEVRKLFDETSINGVWNNDFTQYVINLLGASTGMRMGEIQGLQIQHVHKDYVSVTHSWARKHGLKEPKWNSKRIVPIPNKTSKYLQRVIDQSPYKDSEDLVFYGADRKRPIDHKTILEHLYLALENIGIASEERKTRNVTFHSWRHFFNSI